MSNSTISSAVVTNSVRQKRYAKISDAQRNVLSQFYDSGMTGVGVKHSEAIQKASIESGLPVSKIKVCRFFSNYKYMRYAYVQFKY